MNSKKIIRLFHGTNIANLQILKINYSKNSLIYFTPIFDLSKTYGNYIYYIDVNFNNKLAKKIIKYRDLFNMTNKLSEFELSEINKIAEFMYSHDIKVNFFLNINTKS